ncbi:MAG: DNA mismatch endonuclease Vsr [Deltaproteobacteria bacterium]|nr:MAG: DNA mismatch endonuclease Vsr [Deltaproteobacteria bacterium]
MESTTPDPIDAVTRRRMQQQRRTGTGPEMRIRRALHRAGWRYRVDRPVLEGDRRRRADIVFPRLGVAVFVDGCFWHGCPEHATAPHNNKAWWQAKIAANRRRDRDTDSRLADQGWIAVRVWEHEDVDVAIRRIVEVLEARKPTR